MSAVGDARPPATVLRAVNPVIALALRTPAARLLPSFGLLRFTGRRTGRTITVVVGVHALDGEPAVFTPSAWRANFAGGHPAVLRRQGRTEHVVGTLVTDPARVAAAFGRVTAGGTSLRALAVRAPAGHAITAEDVTALGRAVILFRPAATTGPG